MNTSSTRESSERRQDGTGAREANAVVKLSRALWPQPTTGTSRVGVTEPSKWQQVANSSQPQEPLIHTERLNASSPVIFVHSSRAAPNYMANPIGDRWKLSKERSGRLMAAESNGGQIGHAILAAKSDSPPSTSGRRVKPEWVVRFEVINLELSNSSATLTWSLGLRPPATSSQHSQAEKASHRPPVVEEQKAAKRKVAKRDTIRVTPSLDSDEPTSFDDDGNGDENNTSNNNGEDHKEKKGDHDTSLYNNGSIPRRNKAASTGTRPRSAGARSPGRDQPTTGSALSASSTGVNNGHESRPSRKRDELKKIANRRKKPDDHGSSKAEKRDSTDKDDLLRDKVAHSQPSADPAPMRAPLGATDQISLGRRLQLSRVQGLSTTGPHRRPPGRSQATETTGGMQNSSDIDIVRQKPLGRLRTLVATQPDEAGSTSASLSQASNSTQPFLTRLRGEQEPIIKAPVIIINRLPGRAAKMLDHDEGLPNANETSTPSPSSAELPTTTTAAPTASSSTSTTTTTTTSTTTTEHPQSSSPPSISTSTSTSTSPPSTIEAASSLVNSDIQVEPTTKSVSIVDAPLATTTTTTTTTTSSTTSTSTTVKPSVDPESTTGAPTLAPAANSRASTLVEPEVAQTGTPSVGAQSSWHVRLRRFGSNEVDIVKVMANKQDLLADQPVERRIIFNQLEPASGYELCVESASPNQQVGDRYQILDANHFLKCQDSSDVELAENSGSINSLRRVDMAASQPPEVASQSDRLKSLCREFFTLSTGAQPVNFGARSDLRASNEFRKTIDQAELLSSSLRRPKSLGQALRSHTEVLEVNDLAPSWNTFEMISSGSRAPRNPFGETVGLLAVAPGAPSLAVEREQPPFAFNGSAPGQGATFGDASSMLRMSALPIVGCIFALVFLITLVNLLLSSARCGSRWKSTPRSHRARQSSRRRDEHLADLSLGTQQVLGSSFYSDSEHSATSQSRIILGSTRAIQGIKNSGAPLVGTSTYFEVPKTSLYRRDLDSEAIMNRKDSATARRSSSYLMADGTRFPLGPSFEGDEKHNADMVGLARKNYDNIISNIYNAEPSNRANFENSIRHHRHRMPAHSKQHQPHLVRHASPASSGDSTNGASTSSTGNLHESSDRRDLLNQTQPKQAGGAGSKRQRIRFDKINPIYNMEGIQTFACTSPRKKRSTIRPKLTSFGHSNPALIAEENVETSDGKFDADGDIDVDEDCPMCQLELEQARHSDESARHSAGQSSPDQCDQVSTWPADVVTSASPNKDFTCCLDRQKQRFEKQQEQLERVMTKNGSLIPQPFINPSVPITCDRSQSVDNVEQGREELVVQDDEPGSSIDVQSGTFAQALKPESFPAPPPPPPPPPPPLARCAPRTDGTSEALVIKLGSLEQTATCTSPTGIGRSDFDQRRKELASALPPLLGRQLGHQRSNGSPPPLDSEAGNS